MEVECDNCGDVFDKKPAKVENSDRDFCSRDCYYDFGREDLKEKDSRVEKTCERCGDTFKVYPYRSDTARFCSTECSAQNISDVEGEEHPRWQGGKEEYTCENCGEAFKRYPRKNQSKYCSKECYREASKELFSGEDNPVWRGGWEKYYGPNWDEQREAAIERDDYRCQDCLKPAYKMDKSPDVHHKKRLGWFREEYDAPEWWERANQLDNLVSLCPSCHKKREWLKAD